jgi:hypothetical protein
MLPRRRTGYIDAKLSITASVRRIGVLLPVDALAADQGAAVLALDAERDRGGVVPVPALEVARRRSWPCHARGVRS